MTDMKRVEDNLEKLNQTGNQFTLDDMPEPLVPAHLHHTQTSSLPVFVHNGAPVLQPGDMPPTYLSAAESSGYFEVPRKQVGGDHYSKRALQPFDIVDAYDLDFYEGNALKYLLRWRDKGGIEDLEKAKHYIDCVIERERRGASSPQS